jgi:hypothetical protein
MDGTHYSYIRTSDDQILEYSYEELGRGKLLELIEFHKVYATSVIRLTNWHGEIWRVKFIEDDLDVATEQRANPCGDIPEKGPVTLRFVGIKISG